MPAPPALRVLVLPNTPWRPNMDAFRPGEAPDDPGRFHRLMAERGIAFEVIDPLPPPWNPWGRKHPFFAGIDPLRALKAGLSRADIIMPVFESGAVVPLLLRGLGLLRKPIVLWDASLGGDWRPRRMALNYTLPRVDRLLTLTQGQKATAEQRYRLRAPAAYIGYAIDDEFYHPRFSTAGTYILAVGEDVSRDYKTLIAATAGLDAGVQLKTRQTLELPANPAARFTQIRERLSFLDLRALYAGASIVALPLHDTDHPGGITTLFEAMAMGKPIVASDVPIAREFLVDGETALLTPPGDARALNAALGSLLDNPGEQHRLGAAARAALEADHTMARFADRFAGVLREVRR